MGQTTISWTATLTPDGRVLPGFTFNPWWGCVIKSEGCKNCYADTLSTRYGHDIWGPTKPRRFFGEKHWTEPFKWNRQAKEEGVRLKVFCASMADVFEEPHLDPEVNEQMKLAREQLWNLIKETPWLDWLLLTKRPERFYLDAPREILTNERVWLGTSVENQKRADERLPLLLSVRHLAHILFLSVEPQLGHIDITPWLPYVDWIICGGESGPKHRSWEPAWGRALRDDCTKADKAFFFKQVGGLTSHSGGCLLDGREWNSFPKIKGVLV